MDHYVRQISMVFNTMDHYVRLIRNHEFSHSAPYRADYHDVRDFLLTQQTYKYWRVHQSALVPFRRTPVHNQTMYTMNSHTIRGA